MSFCPHGVDFVSINENIDTGSPYGRAMIGILSAFAQLERENIFLRTRMGMVERVKQGYWPGGGKIPFGYDYDADKGILVPNSDAETVREIYARYLEGQSTGRIARELGLRYEHLVRQILLRESNTGVIVYRGETYRGRHEPLVDPDTFARAVRRLQRSDKPRAAASNKLLTGLLVCGHCGAKMRYQKWGGAGDKLVCYSRDKSKPHLVHDANCPNCGVMARQVEEVVIRDLSRLAAEPVSPRSSKKSRRNAAVHWIVHSVSCGGCMSCLRRERTIPYGTRLRAPDRSAAVRSRHWSVPSRQNGRKSGMQRSRRCKRSVPAGTS